MTVKLGGVDYINLERNKRLVIDQGLRTDTIVNSYVGYGRRVTGQTRLLAIIVVDVNLGGADLSRQAEQPDPAVPHSVQDFSFQVYLDYAMLTVAPKFYSVSLCSDQWRWCGVWLLCYTVLLHRAAV